MQFKNNCIQLKFVGLFDGVLTFRDAMKLNKKCSKIKNYWLGHWYREYGVIFTQGFIFAL